MLVREISEKELDGLIERVKQAIEDNLSLTVTDMKLVFEILLNFAHFQEQLADSDITLHKLEKLGAVGFG